MALTPVDIVHIKFKSSLSGYKKSHVDEFVKSVRETLEQNHREKSQLQSMVETLQAEVDRVRKIEATLTDTLTMAQKCADTLKADAHRQVELILQEGELARVKQTLQTQNEIEKCRGEAGVLRQARDRFEADFRALLSSHLEWLEKRKSDDQTEVA